MWQRFTERARKVVFNADEEARRFGDQVSTEHLLLGLVREVDSVGCRILDRFGVSPIRVRAEVEQHLSRGPASKEMILTQRGKRVLDLAYNEARNLNNNFIGTEHLLLGLIREGDGLAGRILAELGVELERAQSIVVEFQDIERAKVAEPGQPVSRDKGRPRGNPGQAFGVRRPPRQPYYQGSIDSLLLLIRQKVAVPSLLFLTAVADADGIARKLLGSFGIDVDSVQHHVELRMFSRNAPPSCLTFDEVLRAASESAAKRGKALNSGDLLVAVLQLEPDQGLGPQLKDRRITLAEVKDALAAVDVG